MKKLIFALAILFLACPVFADTNSYVAGASGGGAATPHCDSGTVDGAGNTIVICEDADGASDCFTGDTTDNCRNLWTVVGTVDTDYSAAPLEGTYSFDFATSSSYLYKAVTAADAQYAYFKVKINALPASGAKVIFSFNTAGGLAGKVAIYSSGTVYVYNGSISAATTGTVTAGETYYFWTGYTIETPDEALNGTAYVAISQDPATKPNSGNYYKAVTAGNSATQINRIAVGTADASSATVTIDHIRVSATDIGANPP